MMKKASSKTVIHKREVFWAIYFEYDSKLIAKLKKLPGTRWSRTWNAWLVKSTQENKDKLQEIFTVNLSLNTEVKIIPVPSSRKPSAAQPSEVQQLAVAAFTETMRLRNYSANTIKNYRNHLIPFLLWFKDVKPNELYRLLIHSQSKEEKLSGRHFQFWKQGAELSGWHYKLL